MVNNNVVIGGYKYALYLEHDTVEDKRAGRHNGNVTAVYMDNEPYTSNGIVCREAASGVYPHPNSVIETTGVSQAWIDHYCTPIDEAGAREIHPNLFTYLEG